MFYIKTGFFVKPHILGLVLSMTIPIVSCAAVKENPSTDQQDISAVTAAEDPNSSRKTDNEGEDLANEPASRGKLLYENHCHSCHESMVHIRGAHKAKTYEDIQYWVGRWTQELKVKWSAEEIDDVVQYLNQTYYHY
jgi:cytochrome c5